MTAYKIIPQPDGTRDVYQLEYGNSWKFIGSTVPAVRRGEA